MSSGKSELALFDRALPQIVCKQANYQEVYPKNAITSSSNNIQFRITGTGDEYLDLNDTLLYVKLKVFKGDGKDLEDKNTPLPENFFFYTLFHDITLRMNNVVVDGGSKDTYIWTSLIENYLNYSTDTKNTHLRMVGYDEDHDVRREWIAKSEAFDMCGPLRLGMFNQPKYILPGVDVTLELSRTNPCFSLTSAALKPIIRMLDVRLLVRRVLISPSVHSGHQLGLKTQNAHYQHQKGIIHKMTIPTGSLDFYQDCVFGNYRLPNLLVVALVKSATFTGSYKKPIAFEHANISSLTISRGIEFTETYKQDFKHDNGVIASYVKSLIRNFEHLERNTNVGIDFDQFKNGLTLFTFNLCPDLNFTSTQLVREGNLHLQATFAEALPESYNLIVYGRFDSEIQITKDNVVINDFA